VLNDWKTDAGMAELGMYERVSTILLRRKGAPSMTITTNTPVQLHKEKQPPGGGKNSLNQILDKNSSINVETRTHFSVPFSHVELFPHFTMMHQWLLAQINSMFGRKHEISGFHVKEQPKLFALAGSKETKAQ
jgi:hypothetical protein